MKEGIANRVGRIVSGSINALVDAVEGMAPEMVMEQAIREVDAAVAEVRAELGKTLANKHLASRRLMESNRRHEDLAEKIELAIREKREDLAETAVSQQLDIEAQIPILEQTVSDNAAEEKELEGFVAALQAKKREMQEDLREYRQSRVEAGNDATGQPSAGGPGGNTKLGAQGKVDRAASAFERVFERGTGLPAGSSDLATSQKLAELEDLSRKNRVAERLAAAKARVDKEKGGE